MTLAEIVKAGEGKAGAWRVEYEEISFGRRFCTLYHYSTRMLTWTRGPRGGNIKIVDIFHGWGSKSDQDGMNVAFSTLGKGDKFYYSRKGGAKVVDPRKSNDLPSYMLRWRNEDPSFFKDFLSNR